MRLFQLSIGIFVVHGLENSSVDLMVNTDNSSSELMVTDMAVVCDFGSCWKYGPHNTPIQRKDTQGKWHDLNVPLHICLLNDNRMLTAHSSNDRISITNNPESPALATWRIKAKGGARFQIVNDKGYAGKKYLHAQGSKSGEPPNYVRFSTYGDDPVTDWWQFRGDNIMTHTNWKTNPDPNEGRRRRRADRRRGSALAGEGQGDGLPVKGESILFPNDILDDGQHDQSMHRWRFEYVGCVVTGIVEGQWVEVDHIQSIPFETDFIVGVFSVREDEFTDEYKTSVSQSVSYGFSHKGYTGTSSFSSELTVKTEIAKSFSVTHSQAWGQFEATWKKFWYNSTSDVDKRLWQYQLTLLDSCGHTRTAKTHEFKTTPPGQQTGPCCLPGYFHLGDDNQCEEPVPGVLTVTTDQPNCRTVSGRRRGTLSRQDDNLSGEDADVNVDDLEEFIV